MTPTASATIIGTGIGGIGTLERGKELLIESGPKKVPPLSVPLMMSNAASGTLSLRYGLHGNSFGTVSACSAGAHAIGISARADRGRRLRRGRHRRLRGGAHAAVVGRVRARSTRSRTRASRARSTRAATASSWARAPRS